MRGTCGADAVVTLLDAYARDEMGGGRPLSEHVRRNLVPELRKRQGVHVVLAFVGEEAAGLVAGGIEHGVSRAAARKAPGQGSSAGIRTGRG